MNRSTIHCIFACLIFLLGGRLEAVAQQPIWSHYTVEDGLPSYEVYQVLQGPDGFMWFATDRGVARYDGYDFEVFTAKDVLATSVVFGFYVDRFDRIWMMGLEGKLTIYDHGQWIRPSYNKEIPEVLDGALISTLYLDDAGTLWAGTKYISPRNGVDCLKISPDSIITPLALPNNIRALYYIMHLDEGRGAISGSAPANFNTEYPSNLLSLDGDSATIFVIKSVFRDYMKGFGQLHLGGDEWIFTGARSLLHFKGNELIDQLVLGEQVLHGLFLDASGDLWIGTTNGVYHLEEKDGFFRPVDKLLTGSRVSSVVHDNQGGIWLTTLENGVYYLSDEEVRKLHMPKLHEAVVTGVVASGEKLWIAYRQGALKVIEQKADEPAWVVSDSASYQNIQHLHLAAGDQAWASSHYREHDSILPPNFHNVNSNGVDSDSSGRLWGGFSSGLRTFLNDEWDYPLADHMLKVRCHSVCCDRGKVWMGTVSGLFSFQNGTFRNWGLEHDILSKRVERIQPWRNGLALAMRSDGLVLLLPDTVVVVKAEDGLAGNECFSIAVDDDGDIWLGTTRGLDRITFDESLHATVHSYRFSQDVASNMVQSIAFWKGYVWLATDRGVIYFPEDYEPSPPRSLPLLPVALQANDQLDTVLGMARLEGDEVGFKMLFKALNFVPGKQVSYRYRLLGYDSTWRQTTQTFVEYASLPFGDFTFEVQGTVDQAHWSAPQTFSISHPIPFWQKAWVQALVWLCSLFLAILFTFLVIRRRRRAERQRLRLQQRATASELKALRAQMNPHFIFNALNSIHHYIVKSDQENAAAYLKKFSLLMRLVLQQSGEVRIVLQEELRTIALYLELEELRTEFPLRYTVNIDPAIDPERVTLPPLLLQPLFENAIWHGIQPAHRPGEITLGITEQEGQLTLTLEDNGVGFKPQRNAPRKLSSMGLKTVMERLRLLEIGEGIEPNFSIAKISNDAGEIKGTRVVMTLPWEPLDHIHPNLPHPQPNRA